MQFYCSFYITQYLALLHHAILYKVFILTIRSFDYIYFKSMAPPTFIFTDAKYGINESTTPDFFKDDIFVLMFYLQPEAVFRVRN
jgi:hypothetical protein